MPTCQITGIECTRRLQSGRDIYWITIENDIEYAITEEAQYELETDLKDSWGLKANLIHEVIKANYSKKRMIFTKSIFKDEEKNNILSSTRNIYAISSIDEFSPIVNINEKPELLLESANRISQKNINPFDLISITLKERLYSKILTEFEFNKWITELDHSGKIKSSMAINQFSLTPRGFKDIKKSEKLKTTVFIAMSFDPKMIEVRSSIMKILRNSGFEPKIVDEEEFLGGIVEKIINLIRESLFIIADCTQHKNGVYYEAGIAEGMGKPVIYMGDSEDMTQSHFDIKHLNQIRYKNIEELESRLKDRVDYLKDTLAI